MSTYRITELSIQDACTILKPMAKQALPIWHKIEVGKRIVTLRAAKRLTQKALAEAIGISPQKLWNYESGTDALPHEYAASICSATGVDFDYLYRGMIDRLAADLRADIIEARKKSA